MNLYETNDWIRSHGMQLPNGQVYLTKPLYGFKKVFTYRGTLSGPFSSSKYLPDAKLAEAACRDRVHALANLSIPIGSIVNVAQTYNLKLRADKALCWNIIRLHDMVETGIAISMRSGSKGPTVYNPAKDYLGNDLQDFRDVNHVRNSVHGHRSNVFRKFLISPEFAFASDLAECDSGIHFFVEPDLAKNYR